MGTPSVRRWPTVGRRLVRRVLGRSAARGAAGSAASEAPGQERAAQRWSRPQHSAEPSFVSQLQELRRRFHASRLDPDLRGHPMHRLPHKLHTYELAAALGVAVPTILGRWPRGSEVDLADLPEVFVLKAPLGSSSRAVFPLRRVGDRLVLVTGDESWDKEGLRAELGRRESAGQASGGWFAEEFLGDPAAGLPEDVKIYCFYGQVGQVLVRAVARHGDSSTVRRSYYDAEGRLLERVSPLSSAEPIPAPEALTELCEVARRLSLAVSLPFVRVDLYATDRGPVLGELTLAPGGKQRYSVEHDRHLGRLWEEAKTRLEVDHLHDVAEARLAQSRP